MSRKKILLGISGASGAVYAKTLLSDLRTAGAQLDIAGVVMSDTASAVWEHELGEDPHIAVPEWKYKNADLWAPFASGSSVPDVMIIAPCSMGTLGRIAAGTADELITRSADVVLKERKTLILLLREAPFNLVHIRNMATVTEAGGIIIPASPSFYSKPQTVDDLVRTVTDRILDLSGIDKSTFRWSGK